MIIYVDIDNTICKTEGCDYEHAVPYPERIAKVNAWYDSGHKITYWTARGSGSGINWMQLCLKQLDEWGCKYHGVKLGKPVYDVFIEDRSAFFEPLSLPDALK